MHEQGFVGLCGFVKGPHANQNSRLLALCLIVGQEFDGGSESGAGSPSGWSWLQNSYHPSNPEACLLGSLGRPRVRRASGNGLLAGYKTHCPRWGVENPGLSSSPDG